MAAPATQKGGKRSGVAGQWSLQFGKFFPAKARPNRGEGPVATQQGLAKKRNIVLQVLVQ